MTAPTRYPLQWPEGWKRMQSDQRKTATFTDERMAEIIRARDEALSK